MKMKNPIKAVNGFAPTLNESKTKQIQPKQAYRPPNRANEASQNTLNTGSSNSNVSSLENNILIVPDIHKTCDGF